MPVYEYKCQTCGYRTNVRISYKEYDRAKPTCTKCNSKSLERIISKVRIARSEESHIDSLADPASLGGVDENDPKSVGKFMRRMGNEMGEEMGPEFDEMVGRLESGEDPESIEADLPSLSEGSPGPLT
jgi:putative FmdB family regulatory protein